MSVGDGFMVFMPAARTDTNAATSGDPAGTRSEQWTAVFRLRRALQRDAAARCHASTARRTAGQSAGTSILAKTLDQRNDCEHCRLRGERDIVSATLAACVDLTGPKDPRIARVDYGLAHALRAWRAPQQEWGGSVNRYPPPAPSVPDWPGPAAANRRPLLNTRHSAYPRTDQALRLDVAGPAENN
jgi:hypothetical protein